MLVVPLMPPRTASHRLLLPQVRRKPVNGNAANSVMQVSQSATAAKQSGTNAASGAQTAASSERNAASNAE